MTFEELEEIIAELGIFDTYSFEKSEETGEIIIKTGLIETDVGELEPINDVDEDEFDFD